MSCSESLSKKSNAAVSSITGSDVLSCCGRGSRSAKRRRESSRADQLQFHSYSESRSFSQRNRDKISGYPSYLTSQANLKRNPQKITFWCRKDFFDKSDRSRIALTRVKELKKYGFPTRKVRKEKVDFLPEKARNSCC